MTTPSAEECIDCEACVPECPVEAIFHEDDLPDEWKGFTALNREESLKLPVINEHREPLLGESSTPARRLLDKSRRFPQERVAGDIIITQF